MDNEELAHVFETRAAGLRNAAETVSNPQARRELLRLAAMYEDKARQLRGPGGAKP